MEFFLNVFTEFSEFNDIFVITVKGLNQDATTGQQDTRERQDLEPNSCVRDLSDSLNSINSLNSLKVLLHLGKTPICHLIH